MSTRHPSAVCGSDLAEILQHGVDHLEGGINLLSDFGTSKNNLAAHKDEQDDLGLNHTVDQTGEQLWFVRTEIVMARGQTFETNGELDIARTNNVLDLEIRKLCVEAELLDDTSVLS